MRERLRGFENACSSVGCLKAHRKATEQVSLLPLLGSNIQQLRSIGKIVDTHSIHIKEIKRGLELDK